MTAVTDGARHGRMKRGGGHLRVYNKLNIVIPD